MDYYTINIQSIPKKTNSNFQNILIFRMVF